MDNLKDGIALIALALFVAAIVLWGDQLHLHSYVGR